MDATVGGDLYFRVLGPLCVERDGEPLDLGGPQRRIVLAVLLARVNEVVPVDRLVDALWGDTPPSSYRVQLQGLVSDLRRRLAPAGERAAAPIVTSPPGYLLQVPADRVDLAQFRAELAQARRARDDGESALAARIFRAALCRWRGMAFAGVSCPVVDQAAAAVGEMRVAAVEECIDAQLADGQLAGLSAELVALVVEHPMREGLHSQLMKVYARTGRPADALAVYREFRQRIVAELGIEPSAELQRLHREILAAGPTLGASSAELTAGGDGQGLASAYRQLPPDIADFSGRCTAVAAIVEAGRCAPGTAVVISAVEGMAGVGKTKLAVHAAHQLVSEGRYGDGQLYVDLRGFSPAGVPADPAAVLESFLRLLGVPAERIPDNLEARSAAFRDRLAGQHMLVLLDNAADEEQIAPLLPADPNCLIVVTSRRSLALDGSRPLMLDVFTREEAIELLIAVVGEARVAAEPEAASELAARCGRLPLAVALAARRLRARPAWPIAHLVTRLTDESRRLDELSLGRLAIEPVFALSYDALKPDQQRLLRLLGIHPGRDFTAAPVAALAEVSPVEAEDMLESLLDEHLLQQSVLGRYVLHDLLRAYAARLCRVEDTVDDRRMAIGRLLDWYLHATDAATRLIRRFPAPVVGGFAPPTAPSPSFPDQGQALTWLDVEYANLAAVQRHAAAGPWYAHAIQLPHLLQPYFIRRSRVGDWIAAQHLAEAAASRLDDRGALAHALTDLGHAYATAGQTRQALGCLQRGLNLHRRLGDRHGEAINLNHLGLLCRRLGRHTEAVDHYKTALALFGMLDDRPRVASTQSNLSVDLHLLGRSAEALDHAHQALELQHRLGGPGEAALRTNLGLMYAQLNQHAEAVAHTCVALALHREAGSGPGEAHALANLSFSYSRLGRHDEAVEFGRQAVSRAQHLTDPELEATTLNTLGEAYHLSGDHRTALQHHRQALATAVRIGDAGEQSRARDGIAAASRLLV
jgi:DNA-binding SARP family transcriptional activator/tetratricopeptide (TPR) repeat protein